MVFGRTTVARVRAASLVLPLGALSVLTFTLVAAGPLAAQQRQLDVTIEPGPEFPASTAVIVTVEDLGDFVTGRAVIYQCGNADASGAPIEPTEKDCFAPGNTSNYLVLPIGGPTLELTYPMRLDGIGENGASCVPAAPGADDCQLVVAVAQGDDAVLVGVSLDDVVTAAQETELDQLPVTGLSGTAELAIAGLAVGLLYLGWFSWSAARPARARAAVRRPESTGRTRRR